MAQKQYARRTPRPVNFQHESCALSASPTGVDFVSHTGFGVLKLADVKRLQKFLTVCEKYLVQFDNKNYRW